MKLFNIIFLVGLSLPAQAVLIVKADENGEAKIGKTTFKLIDRAIYDVVVGDGIDSRLITINEPRLGIEGTIKIDFKVNSTDSHPFEQTLILEGDMSLSDISAKISSGPVVHSLVYVRSAFAKKLCSLAFLSKVPGLPLRVDITDLKSQNHLDMENIFPETSLKTMEKLALSYSRSDRPGEIFYATSNEFAIDENIILDFSR